MWRGEEAVVAHEPVWEILWVVEKRYQGESNRRAYGVKDKRSVHREKLPTHAYECAAVRPAHRSVDDHHRRSLESSGFGHQVPHTRWE